MRPTQTHDATGADGGVIAGTVLGEGPPLVFIHGVTGDGDLDWKPVAEHLAEQFTCYLPSTRGRGRSDDHPDHSIHAMVEDMTAYVASVGEPTGVAGWSSGAGFALGVAARSDAVAGVAVVDPPARLAASVEEEQASDFLAVTRVVELAADGELREAARTFLGMVMNEREITALGDAGYFEAARHYVPQMLHQIQSVTAEDMAALEDPAELSSISSPVLVMGGTESPPFFRRSATYLGDHLVDSRFQDIAGAGHAAPLTHAPVLARALAGFFEPR